MARILVVDDEADIRFVVESLLLARGHSVCSAVDAPGALEALSAEPFDVLVLDIMMPGTSGIEVLDRIRADCRLRDLPVLVLSAAADAAGRTRGLRHGADDYVGKPFDLEELALRVERLAERSRGREAILSGELEFLGTEGLLEALSQAHLAARISVPASDGVGEIALLQGRLVVASFGALEGIDAVLALLEEGQGRFSIVREEVETVPPEGAPLVSSLLLERAWLEDEIAQRRAAVPGAHCALEPGEGGLPAGRAAKEVPWQRVLDSIREQSGITPSELAARLAVAPARLRLALALLVEAGGVRVGPPRPPAAESRLAGLLADLLLEALFSGQDIDRLKIEVFADPPAFLRAEGWLAEIPEALREGPVERPDPGGGQVTAHLRHSTGSAVLVLRRIGGPERGATSVSGDALFCVLLLLERGPQAREREARLLAELAQTRPGTAELVVISAARSGAPVPPPWRRTTRVPATLADLFEQLRELSANG